MDMGYMVMGMKDETETENRRTQRRCLGSGLKKEG